MVHGQDQHMLRGRQTQQAGTQQWAAGKVEWPLGLLKGIALDLSGLSVGRKVVEIEQGQRERNGGIDRLERLAILAGKAGAEHLVAFDERSKAAAQSGDIERAPETDDRAQVVGRA